MHTRRFFNLEEEQRIIDAIRHAESQSSAEVRVHINKHSEGDVVSYAQEIFTFLGMDKTELHNGVLIYLAVENRNFAVIGDHAIHERVGQIYWDTLRNEMQAEFKNESVCSGIVHAIEKLANTLKKYFPVLPKDKNEIIDDISYG